MSSAEDRNLAKLEQEALDIRYSRARAEIERSRKVEAGQAGALMFAAMAYGDVLENNALFATASHLAKLFCIASAFIIPNLLFMYLMF